MRGSPLKDAGSVTERDTQTQTCRWVPWHRRNRSRNSAPTAVASSMRIPRIPSRTRRRSRTCSRSLPILLIPFALTYTFGKLVGDTRQGWAVLATMLILLVSLILVAYYSEQRGNPLVAKQGIDQIASHLQSGGNMEGKETRFGIAASAIFAAVTTGNLLRRRQHDARLDDAARRIRAAVPDPARRTGARRRGHGPVHDPDLRHPRCVHRRPDDRPHARIPRQEDRSNGNEARLDLHPDDTLHRPDRHRGGRSRSRPARRESRIRAPTASARSSTPFPRRRTTTAAPSPVCRQTPSSINVALGLAMWFGRFWPIVAALAIAGSLAAKKRIPVERRHDAHARRLVHRVADRFDPADRRAHLCTGARARTGRRALHARRRRVRETPMSRQQLIAVRSQAAGAGAAASRYASSIRGCNGAIRSCSWSTSARSSPLVLYRAGARRTGRGPGGFHRRHHAVARLHRAVRELRRGAGRRPQPCAGRGAAWHAPDRAREEVRSIRVCCGATR